MKIEVLDFTVRTYNCLRRAGIITVEQLQELSTLDLLKIRSLGRRSLEEIEKKLADLREPRTLLPAEESPKEKSTFTWLISYKHHRGGDMQLAEAHSNAELLEWIRKEGAACVVVLIVRMEE